MIGKSTLLATAVSAASAQAQPLPANATFGQEAVLFVFNLGAAPADSIK